MTPLEIRVGRPLQGLAVEVFVAARRGDATAWLEFDTANNGPVLLDTRLDARWGAKQGDRAAPEIVPGEDWETEMVLRDLIIDGNLGATFLENRAFTLDLRQPKLWVDRGSPGRST